MLILPVPLLTLKKADKVYFRPFTKVGGGEVLNAQSQKLVLGPATFTLRQWVPFERTFGDRGPGAGGHDRGGQPGHPRRPRGPCAPVSKPPLTISGVVTGGMGLPYWMSSMYNMPAAPAFGLAGSPTPIVSFLTAASVDARQVAQRDLPLRPGALRDGGRHRD